MDETLAKLEMVTLAIKGRLKEIKELCKSGGLPKLTHITLIARNPLSETMIIVVTNEEGDLKPALDAALKQDKIDRGLVDSVDVFLNESAT